MLALKPYTLPLMHQSIPAVPIPPPGQPRGICSNVCPGGGALAILSQPGGWALAYPGATPGHLTHVFLNMEEFVGKDEDFVKDWLVRHGLEKLVDVFKSMFSQF